MISVTEQVEKNFQSHYERYEAARLRWATLKDIPALVDLYNKARANQSENLKTMAAWLEYGGGLVLESSEGQMLCALRWRETDKGWQVDRIATLEKARGQGYGRWLMTKVEALAIRNNIPCLMLILDEIRADLANYYQRMGYKVLERLEDKLILQKRVGGVWQYK